VSLAALIAVSFFPADRLPLIEIVTVPFAITAFIGHRRSGTRPAPLGTPSLGEPAAQPGRTPRLGP
jgi:hypothetical protein